MSNNDKHFVDIDQIIKEAENKNNQRRKVKPKTIEDWRKKFEEDYKSGKFVDLNYLFEAFKGDDLKYLKKLFKMCQKKKYPVSPLLNEYLFLSTVNHRLHIAYIYSVEHGKTPDNSILRTITFNQEKLAKLEEELARLKDEEVEKKNIVDLHQEVMEQASKFLRENTGEIAIKCEKCGAILGVDGKLFWGIYQDEIDGHKFSLVWSRELWQLVVSKKIPLSYMAFALRTSIVGILEVAKIRKEKVPEWINIPEEEKKLSELQNRYIEVEKEKQKERVKRLKGE